MTLCFVNNFRSLETGQIALIGVRILLKLWKDLKEN